MANMYTILQQLCAAKKITITDMCREAGVPRSSVGNLARGSTKQLSAKNVQKIASYFNVSTDCIFGNEQKEKPVTDNGNELDILDHIDVGFLGDYKELTDENKAILRDMVRIMRDRQGGA